MKKAPAQLIDEEFISVQPSLVRALDGRMEDAALLQVLHFWLRVSTNRHDGETWVYNTYQDWADRLGISADRARRCVTRLEGGGSGPIVSTQAERSSGQMRKWYRIDYGHPIFAEASGELATHLADLPIGLAPLPDASGNLARSTYPTERTTERTTPPTASLSPRPCIATDNDQGMATDNAIPPHSPSPPEAAAPPLPMTEEEPIVTTVTQAPSKVDKPTDGRGTIKPKKKASKNPDLVPTFEVAELVELFVETYNAREGNKPLVAKGAPWNKVFRLMLASYGPDGGWTVDEVKSAIIWSINDDFWSRTVHQPHDLSRNMRKISSAMKPVGRSGVASKRTEAQKSDLQRMREELS